MWESAAVWLLDRIHLNCFPVRVHQANFVGNDVQCYFIKVTNRGGGNVLVTHAWFAADPEVPVLEPKGSLPAKLGHADQWEGYVPVSALADAVNVERLGRVRLSTKNRALKSRRDKHVPSIGYVAATASPPAGEVHRMSDEQLSRIAATYEELLEMVGWRMEVVDATKPIFTVGEPPEPPPKPEDERIRKVQARIGAHGSKEVKAILERWAKRRNEFFTDAWYLDAIQNDRTSTDAKATYGITLTDQWQKVEADRKDLHGIVRELEDVVSAELRA